MNILSHPMKIINYLWDQSSNNNPFHAFWRLTTIYFYFWLWVMFRPFHNLFWWIFLAFNSGTMIRSFYWLNFWLNFLVGWWNIFLHVLNTFLWGIFISRFSRMILRPFFVFLQVFNREIFLRPNFFVIRNVLFYVAILRVRKSFSFVFDTFIRNIFDSSRNFGSTGGNLIFPDHIFVRKIFLFF